MSKRYRKQWILLREKLTHKENEAERYSPEKDVYHNVLVMMTEIEAAEFLEE